MARCIPKKTEKNFARSFRKCWFFVASVVSARRSLGEGGSFVESLLKQVASTDKALDKALDKARDKGCYGRKGGSLPHEA